MKQTEDVNIDCLFHFLFWKKAWWSSQPLRKPACNLLIELLTDWWDNWQVCQTDRKSVRWPASRREPGRSAKRWRRLTVNPSLSRRSGLRSVPSVRQCSTKPVMSFTTRSRNNNVNLPLLNGKQSVNISYLHSMYNNWLVKVGLNSQNRFKGPLKRLSILTDEYLRYLYLIT